MSDYNTNPQGRELGWDDEIENDSPEFITLPEGEYPFRVVGFERGRYQPTPNSKLPPCNVAILTVELTSPEGFVVPVKDKLYLHSSTEGFLCEFFTSIGQRKHGERVRMNWNAVMGATGRAKVGIRHYKKDGEDRTINEIKKYLEPSEQAAPAPSYPSAPGYPAGGFAPNYPTGGFASAPTAAPGTAAQQTSMPGYNFNRGHF